MSEDTRPLLPDSWTSTPARESHNYYEQDTGDISEGCFSRPIYALTERSRPRHQELGGSRQSRVSGPSYSVVGHVPVEGGIKQLEDVMAQLDLAMRVADTVQTSVKEEQDGDAVVPIWESGRRKTRESTNQRPGAGFGEDHDTGSGSGSADFLGAGSSSGDLGGNRKAVRHGGSQRDGNGRSHDDDGPSKPPSSATKSPGRRKKGQEKLACFFPHCERKESTISQLLRHAQQCTTHSFSFCDRCCEGFSSSSQRIAHQEGCREYCISSKCISTGSVEIQPGTFQKHVRGENCPSWQSVPPSERREYLCHLASPDWTVTIVPQTSLSRRCAGLADDRSLRIEPDAQRREAINAFEPTQPVTTESCSNCESQTTKIASLERENAGLQQNLNAQVQTDLYLRTVIRLLLDERQRSGPIDMEKTLRFILNVVAPEISADYPDANLPIDFSQFGSTYTTSPHNEGRPLESQGVNPFYSTPRVLPDDARQVMKDLLLGRKTGGTDYDCPMIGNSTNGPEYHDFPQQGT